MAISKEKQEALQQRMEKLGILEDDLVEKFILGSGSGGQKVNKTHSCVYLKHIPSGLEIKCQRDRSREMNRYLARKELCEQQEEIQLKEKSSRQMEIEKIRRQKKRRSRKSKEKMLEDKRNRSEKKESRQKPTL
ncbi:MAG TPA: peptide chain release factor-like protein [Chlamydiales bacterium]|jgi:protein subunit release factor B|nr:peptide chain release factor-like protein [Chlamydiales bacterium]